MTHHDQINTAQDLWAKAVISAQPDSVIKLYSEKALLSPTFSPVIRKGHQEIKN